MSCKHEKDCKFCEETPEYAFMSGIFMGEKVETWLTMKELYDRDALNREGVFDMLIQQIKRADKAEAELIAVKAAIENVMKVSI